MVLAERCVLLSAEILKSQGKYSESAALLIRLTSEVCKCEVSLGSVSATFNRNITPDKKIKIQNQYLGDIKYLTEISPIPIA